MEARSRQRFPPLREGSERERMLSSASAHIAGSTRAGRIGRTRARRIGILTTRRAVRSSDRRIRVFGISSGRIFLRFLIAFLFGWRRRHLVLGALAATEERRERERGDGHDQRSVVHAYSFCKGTATGHPANRFPGSCCPRQSEAIPPGSLPDCRAGRRYCPRYWGNTADSLLARCCLHALCAAEANFCRPCCSHANRPHRTP